MSLKIRLARGGSKHRPYYNVVIADSRFARDGRFIEKIGAYNPLLGKKDDAKRIVRSISRKPRSGSRRARRRPIASRASSAPPAS